MNDSEMMLETAVYLGETAATDAVIREPNSES